MVFFYGHAVLSDLLSVLYYAWFLWSVAGLSVTRKTPTRHHQASQLSNKHVALAFCHPPTHAERDPPINHCKQGKSESWSREALPILRRDYTSCHVAPAHYSTILLNETTQLWQECNNRTSTVLLASGEQQLGWKVKKKPFSVFGSSGVKKESSHPIQA